MEKKKIAVFGGSFNPPLYSHFSIGEQILNEFKDVEKVIYQPVSEVYPKEGLLSDEHRLNMLKLVCDKNDRFILSDVEQRITKDKYVISSVIMRELKKEFPDYEFYFVIGTDNLEYISEWEGVDDLINENMIMVVNRGTNCFEEIIDRDEYLTAHKDRFVLLKNNNITNMSSTFVRRKIRNNDSVRYLTDDEIIEYINKNNLYR